MLKIVCFFLFGTRREGWNAFARIKSAGFADFQARSHNRIVLLRCDERCGIRVFSASLISKCHLTLLFILASLISCGIGRYSYLQDELHSMQEFSQSTPYIDRWTGTRPTRITCMLTKSCHSLYLTHADAGTKAAFYFKECAAPGSGLPL